MIYMQYHKTSKRKRSIYKLQRKKKQYYIAHIVIAPTCHSNTSSSKPCKLNSFFH